MITGLFVLEGLEWIEVRGATCGEHAGGHPGEERSDCAPGRSVTRGGRERGLPAVTNQSPPIGIRPGEHRYLRPGAPACARRSLGCGRRDKN